MDNIFSAVAEKFKTIKWLSATAQGTKKFIKVGSATAESIKIINLMGDDQDELFIQNTTNVTIFDGGGNSLLSQNYQNPKTYRLY